MSDKKTLFAAPFAKARQARYGIGHRQCRPVADHVLSGHERIVEPVCTDGNQVVANARFADIPTADANVAN